MAERRMYAKTIVLSDAFLDMPMSARCLYFTLGMVADDDGFVNRPKAIMRECGASQDDLAILVTKKFLLAFESGVIVIKHWRLNNYLRSDRYTETKYVDEKSMITIEENGIYSMSGIPGGIPSIDKDSIDKDSIDKDSKGKDSKGKDKMHKHGEYKNVLLTDNELEKLKTEYPNDYALKIDKLSEYVQSTGKSYNSHYATIRMWAKRDAERKEKEAKQLKGAISRPASYDIEKIKEKAKKNTTIKYD